MDRDTKAIGIEISLVAIAFIGINIILFESGIANLNPFYYFYFGLTQTIAYSFDISGSLVYLPAILMYTPVIALGIYYMLKKEEFQEGTSNTNLYFEYRQWNFFWGYFFDGKKEVQNILDYHNEKGWKLIDFEWANIFSHLGIIRTIGVYYITFLTFGVLSYWGGFYAIFEGVKDNGNHELSSTDNSPKSKKNIDNKAEIIKSKISINDSFKSKTNKT